MKLKLPTLARIRYMCFDLTHALVTTAATGLVSMSTRPDPEGSGTVEIGISIERNQHGHGVCWMWTDRKKIGLMRRSHTLTAGPCPRGDFGSRVSRLQSSKDTATINKRLPCFINGWMDSFALPVWRVYSPCLLYTSPSPRDLSTSRMPSSA